VSRHDDGCHLWGRSQPLLFLNGCETAAVEPAQLPDFAGAFVRAGAGGVIGTETTVFEPMATVFAEKCWREFLVNGRSIGEAVRLARLALLGKGDPLGLVYTAFMLPSVKLIKN
jgi:CHAT domain-containing protein